jgi:hypothetical protein
MPERGTYDGIGIPLLTRGSDITGARSAILTQRSCFICGTLQFFGLPFSLVVPLEWFLDTGLTIAP